MAALSEYVLEPLLARERNSLSIADGSRVTHRRCWQWHWPLISRRLQSLQRLEHEYSLAAESHPSWAAKPLALTRYEGRTILILKDPGGEPLDLILERQRGATVRLGSLPTRRNWSVESTRPSPPARPHP